MLTLKEKRQIIKVYEEKIAAAHVRFQEATAIIPPLLAQIERAREQYDGLVTELERVRGDIRAANAHLNEVNSQVEKVEEVVQAAHDQYEDITFHISQKENSHQLTTKTAAKELSKLLSKIERSRVQLPPLEERAEKVKAAAASARRDEFEAKREAKRATVVIAKAEAKEKEVRELIAKNSQICALSAKNLGTIEVYVKRLQRVYDQRGININVLKQFGVVRDRQ